MSYGSTFLQFEANGRISHRYSRSNFKKEENDHPPKLVQYEKQFDVNLSRVDDHVKVQTNIKDSMVAYTRKMRTIQDARYATRDTTGKEDPLFVRAKHIPKYPSKPAKKRRPMSFDELLGRDREAGERRDRPGAARTRPQSDKVKPAHARDVVDRKSDNELHLPLLTDRLRKSGNVQVSLVSASDLYEIVDFSLRSKPSRNESLHMLRMEKEAKSRKEPVRVPSYSNDNYKDTPRRDSYDAYERTIDRPLEIASKERNHRDTRVDPRYSAPSYDTPEFPDDADVDSNNKLEPCDDPVPSDEFYAEMFHMEKVENDLKKQPTVNMFSPLRLPTLSTEPFKRRPNRAKRMRLVDPGLGDIPEDNVAEMRDNSYESKRGVVRVVSPVPQKLSPRNLEATNASKLHLDAIRETPDRDNESVTETRVTNVTNHNNSVVQAKSEPPATSEPDSQADYPRTMRGGRNSGAYPEYDASKSMKKIIRDDGDIRIEVTQCPPKSESVNNKTKAQKRFKKLIFLRDGSR